MHSMGLLNNSFPNPNVGIIYMNIFKICKPYKFPNGQLGCFLCCHDNNYTMPTHWGWNSEKPEYLYMMCGNEYCHSYFTKWNILKKITKEELEFYSK